MDNQEIIILVFVLLFLTCLGCRQWFRYLGIRLFTSGCSVDIRSLVSPTDEQKRNYFQIRLPRTMDFDGAIVTVTSGGQRLTQINPAKEGVQTSQLLHFDLGLHRQVDSVEIYTPQDNKKYDFLAPRINSTLKMEPPMAYFDYYDSDFKSTRVKNMVR